MRILIIVHALTGGGAERVAVSWANGLIDLGHSVEIMADLSNQTYNPEPGVTLIHKHKLFENKHNLIYKIIRKVMEPFTSFWNYCKYLRKSKPDAILSVLYVNPICLLLARNFSLKKCPIIMTSHNAYERPKGYEFTKIQKRRRFFFNKYFDLVTVLTKADKNVLKNKGITNVEVLYNPLFLQPVKEIPQKENIILAVGRLDAWQVKGFDILIKAWERIYNQHPDWRLRIVGAGSTTSIKYLKSLAINSINTIDFIPFTKNIENEYKRAAVFVLSSRYEGWGLVAVEAMSQGCAVVACDYEGRQSELITTPDSGLITEPANIEMLASNITTLLSDENLRLKLQKNGPKKVTSFSEIKVAARLETLIQAAILKR